MTSAMTTVYEVLTPSEAAELGRLAKTRQAVHGATRTRTQCALVAKGLAVFIVGKDGQPEWCAVTKLGTKTHHQPCSRCGKGKGWHMGYGGSGICTRAPGGTETGGYIP